MSAVGSDLFHFQVDEEFGNFFDSGNVVLDIGLRRNASKEIRMKHAAFQTKSNKASPQKTK